MSALSCMVWHWLLSINVSIWQLSTSTGLPDRGASSSEKSLAWNFANHFWIYPISHSTFSIYSTNLSLFFAIQLCYLSWNNKAQYAENIAYLLPSLILKWLLKNSPILIFLMHADVTAVTIQTKLFWTKLKTTKCY